MSKTVYVKASLVVLAGKLAAQGAKRRTLAKLAYLNPMIKEQAIDALVEESRLMLECKEHEIDTLMDLYMKMID